MESYKISILPAAQNDLREIVDYLNTLSPQAAVSYYDMIVERIASLTQMPKRYALVKDAQLRLKGYRTLIIKHYIVFYVVKEKTVEIRRILFARRQYQPLL